MILPGNYRPNHKKSQSEKKQQRSKIMSLLSVRQMSIISNIKYEYALANSNYVIKVSMGLSAAEGKKRCVFAIYS